MGNDAPIQFKQIMVARSKKETFRGMIASLELTFNFVKMLFD